MRRETGIARLSDVFVGLAAEAAIVQQRFDREFLGRLKLQRVINEIAAEVGHPSVARDIAPSLHAVQEIRFEAKWTWTRTESNETRMAVRLLNIRFQRRFEAAGSMANRLKLIVRRIPLEPGRDVETSSPPRT